MPPINLFCGFCPFVSVNIAAFVHKLLQPTGLCLAMFTLVEPVGIEVSQTNPVMIMMKWYGCYYATSPVNSAYCIAVAFCRPTVWPMQKTRSVFSGLLFIASASNPEGDPGLAKSRTFSKRNQTFFEKVWLTSASDQLNQYISSSNYDRIS